MCVKLGRRLVFTPSHTTLCCINSLYYQEHQRAGARRNRAREINSVSYNHMAKPAG